MRTPPKPMTGDNVTDNGDASPLLSDLLAGLPKNWGRWGQRDEVGALNLLTEHSVLEAARCIRSGKTFTLGARIGTGHDPVWPGRDQARRRNTRDRQSYVDGVVEPSAGGLEFADDVMTMALQGTTHCDALGHTWYDGHLYNGYPAAATNDGLDVCSVLPIAERGIVGRGVLLDLPRYLGKTRLSQDDRIGVSELLGCAKAQGVEISPRTILLLWTGVLAQLKAERRPHPGEDYAEPGLAFSPELVRWFYEREIPCLGTDTLGNEATYDTSGASMVLHGALSRDLGVVFCEVLELDELAADCAADGQYEFMFVGAPLKVVDATGSPVNPIVVK